MILDEKKYIVQTYKRYNLQLVKGKGQYVWDRKGKKYLDFFAGISVCNAGHCHPRIVNAINKQAGRLIHVSNFYYTEPNIKLAKTLVKRTFDAQVFFSNSGAEANECAIKLSRKWGKIKSKGRKSAKKYEIIVFYNSFHGRTMASLTATGQKKYHKGFEPMLSGFKYAQYNDINSVKKLVSSKTAAIMLEVIQGEGGVYPAKREFLQALKKICNKKGILLIFDEVQTGIGRTGKLFAYQNFGVVPDIITTAKSLGSGLPVAATIVGKKVVSAFAYGDHGSTFGGSLVPCAAACELLNILTPKFLSGVKAKGAYFVNKLEKLKKKYAFIKQIRAIGLMIGLELDFPGIDIVKSCQDKGLLINCTNNTVLRFLPPLIINRKDIDKAVRILDEVLSCQKLKK